ncbi:MAG: hypothetical protein AAF267_22900 [Deinococcota bacterium]
MQPPFNTTLFDKVLQAEGVTASTMMKTPCVRYNGDFMAMLSDKFEALIIKVAPERVNELIDLGIGREFNVTKKRFKSWVMIPPEHQHDYPAYLDEALAYARDSADS